MVPGICTLSLPVATGASPTSAPPAGRSLFLEILEQVRRPYDFVLAGCVIMPEHFHLLISEPERGNPSTVMQVLKQRFAHRLLTRWRKQQLQTSSACGRRPSRP
jgi:REP element-mobilizing transposase RayT